MNYILIGGIVILIGVIFYFAKANAKLKRALRLFPKGWESALIGDNQNGGELHERIMYKHPLGDDWVELDEALKDQDKYKDRYDRFNR